MLDRKINFSAHNVSVSDAIELLSEQENFDYSYASSIFTSNKKVEKDFSNRSIKSILKEIVDQKNIRIREKKNHLFFVKVKSQEKEFIKSSHQLSGVILNEKTHLPIHGAIIRDKHLMYSARSQAEGQFSLTVNNPDQVLLLTVYAENYYSKDLRIRLNAEKHLAIKLREIPIERDTSQVQLQSKSSPLLVSNSSNFNPFIVVPEKYKTVLSQKDSIRLTPLNLGLFPPLNTNNDSVAYIMNNFSFNAFFDYSAGIDGIGISSLFNYYRFNSNGISIGGLANYYGGNIKGIGIAGLVNLVEKNTTGFQFAGLLNNSMGSFYGMQFSGLASFINGQAMGMQFSGLYNYLKYGGQVYQFSGLLNQSNHEITYGMQVSGLANTNLGKLETGLQIAGLLNYNKKQVSGIQIAGGLNLLPDTLKGIQIAGLANTSKVSDGLQISGAINYNHDQLKGVQVASFSNYTKSLKGLQIGVVNYTQNLNGFQLGIVNVSDTISWGAPIGLFSFVRKGLREIEFVYDVDDFKSVGIRTGVRQFYNMIYGGLNDSGSDLIAKYGYGVGTQFTLSKKTDLNLEYLASQVQQQNVGYHANVYTQVKLKSTL